MVAVIGMGAPELARALSVADVLARVDESYEVRIARSAVDAAAKTLASLAYPGSVAVSADPGVRATTPLGGSFAQLIDLTGAVVLLDGSHDWLSPAIDGAIPVTVKVKADRTCAAVAAASVLAKVQRDRLMIGSDAVHPGYVWTSNKGYASAEHYAGIDRIGPSPLHRWSWLKQPGLFDLDALGA